jgi:putative spermidine/putrescine transport system ATP-binding protein
LRDGAGAEAPADRHAHLPGVVRDVTYLGSDRRVEVETPDGGVVVRTSPQAALRPGDHVDVSWDPQVAPAFSDPAGSAGKEQ